jgi:hypothetical protein
MKKNAVPIPVRSVMCMPRWLLMSAVWLCSMGIAGGIGLAVYGLAVAPRHELGGWLGGGLGSAFGCAGGLFGTLRDSNRRLPAPVLWRQLQQAPSTRFYRRVFWPALIAFGLGLLLACFWNHRVIWHGLVQTGGMLAFVSGTIEVMQRHTRRKAHALFALYSDGALDPDDTAAIDDARAKDPEFDAEVCAWQQVGAHVQDLLAPRTH